MALPPRRHPLCVEAERRFSRAPADSAARCPCHSRGQQHSHYRVCGQWMASQLLRDVRPREAVSKALRIAGEFEVRIRLICKETLNNMATLPLAGLGVAITRPSDQAKKLTSLIEAAGGHVILFPLIEIVGLATLSVRLRILPVRLIILSVVMP